MVLVTVTLIWVVLGPFLGGGAFPAAPFAVIILAATLVGVLQAFRAAHRATARIELVNA